MNIKIGRLENAKDIAKNNCLLANESENIDLSYEKTLSGVKNVISDQLKGFYLIAIENGIIIGQLMITYEWSDWRDKNIWWIQSVYVNEDYRRKNIFKNMLNYIKKLAEKKRILKLNLYVYQENIKAKLAYEKTGMKKDNYDIYKLKLC